MRWTIPICASVGTTRNTSASAATMVGTVITTSSVSRRDTSVPYHKRKQEPARCDEDHIERQEDGHGLARRTEPARHHGERRLHAAHEQRHEERQQQEW